VAGERAGGHAGGSTCIQHKTCGAQQLPVDAADALQGIAIQAQLLAQHLAVHAPALGEGDVQATVPPEGRDVGQQLGLGDLRARAAVSPDGGKPRPSLAPRGKTCMWCPTCTPPRHSAAAPTREAWPAATAPTASCMQMASTM
jgi:hypothetical protein